ncbi:hypothetical protein HBI15_164020 [Parastagonospora nodorum]|nr:hypothetical protein HBI15_164020 [Parastagonospora nodorum]
MLSTHCPLRELEARHSLLNFSVYNLVEEQRLESEAQLRKASEEEELAKIKKEKREKELDSLLDSDNYCLDSSLDINSKNNLENEEATTNERQSLCKSRDSNRTLHSRRLIDVYILYFKELLSNNSRIFANAIGIGKTRVIVLAVLIEHFCFFSNSLSKNIGRLTKEKAIKMQINTTNAISKALATANKLIILEANMPAVHSKATKHYSALLAAQFVIVCSFRKIDKHMFRAYNTISVTAQRTIIRKGSSYIKKRAILLPNFLSIVQNAKQQYRDILEKEGLNKLEASRRIIFNCFKIQAIASYPTLATLKASIAVEDAAKAANILLLPKKVCAKILIESYKPIVQAIIVALIAFAEAITLIEATHVLAEMCVSIVYFNSDSKLKLKVLGKQDVKTTF